jgi:hypothetical protein
MTRDPADHRGRSDRRRPDESVLRAVMIVHANRIGLTCMTRCWKETVHGVCVQPNHAVAWSPLSDRNDTDCGRAGDAEFDRESTLTKPGDADLIGPGQRGKGGNKWTHARSSSP